MLGLLRTDNFIASSTITNNGTGTLVLTSSSNHIQTLTGTSAPIVRLPDTTTLSLGHSFAITNLSDVSVRVEHSGSTEIRTLTPLETGTLTCLDTSTNLPASWEYSLSLFSARGDPTPLPAIRTVSTGTYTMLKTDTSLIFTVSCVVTLYPPTQLPGKVIYMKAIAPVVVTSSLGIVIPLDSLGGAGTAILSGADGESVKMQSDGNLWVIMGQATPDPPPISSGDATAIQLSDGSGGFTNDTDLAWDTSTNSLTLGSGSEIIFAGDQVAIGSSMTTASGTNAIAIGASSSATANDTTSIGENASVTFMNGFALGVDAVSNGMTPDSQAAYAIGDNAQSLGTHGIAIGKDAFLNTLRNISIGENARSFAPNVCIGRDAVLGGGAANGVAIGQRANAQGGYSIALGLDARTQGPGGSGTSSFNLAVGVSARGGISGAHSNCTAIGGEVMNTQGTALGIGSVVAVDAGIAIGWGAYAGPWVANTNAPLAFPAIIGLPGPGAAVQPGGPAPGPPIERLRIHIGGFSFMSNNNYTIPLYADS